MLIEALQPLTVTANGQRLTLTPGCPVLFSEDQGRRLLTKARGKVRRVPPPLAVGDTVFLDDGEGPLTVCMVDTDPRGVTWVLVREPNLIRWINATFLVKVERLTS